MGVSPRLTTRNLKNFYHRSRARIFAKRLVKWPADKPVVSFTFDDFPRTALTIGGRILNCHGVAGSYDASFGLLGTKSPTGEIFSRDDLSNLLTNGHEIGCHTFDHLDAGNTDAMSFEESINKNIMFAADLLPAHTITRTLVIIEQLIGVLYPVVLIGRLVSLV